MRFEHAQRDIDIAEADRDPVARLPGLEALAPGGDALLDRARCEEQPA